MASNEDVPDTFVRIGDAEAVREAGRTLANADGHHVAVFHHDGEFHAVDNRCPHMGFPLTEGTVEEGILTCHWHHARFELSCGDTFDPWADDVASYPVEVRDGGLYVDPRPAGDGDPVEHYRDRLRTGMQENLDLVVAKSVIGLEDAGVGHEDPLWAAVDFGTTYREFGWGRGLTTLGVMANLLEHVRPEDRARALYRGITDVASDSAGESPFFEQKAFRATDLSADRLEEWFRENVEVRDGDGAERVIRTAVRADLPEEDVAGMLFAAATDHRYMNTGHTLDFVNKAFETLDRIGWEHAEQVLATLVPQLTSASRAEEQSAWRQPVDVAGLAAGAFEVLPPIAADADGGWTEPEGFEETLLSDDPEAIVDALTDAVSEGATAEQLARVVTAAAARRVAQFGTSNEFGDWDTVHHTFTYANAVHGAARRTDAWEVYRGVYDAAIKVYLDRFLNTPPTPVPAVEDTGRDPEVVLDELLETFEVEALAEVNRAGELTAEYVDVGGDRGTLVRALGEVLLREDVGFHTNQNLEAAVAQLDLQDDPARERTTLVATARYLSAHTPTRRSAEQTFSIARRLHDGERIHED